MNTTDQVLLIIVTVLLSILLLAGIFVLVGVIKLISVIRSLVTKAEGIVDTVESASDILRDTQGRLAMFKLIRNIMHVSTKAATKAAKKGRK